MANIKTSFLNDEMDTELQLYYNAHNQIYIKIDNDNGYEPSYICLDRSTAIKLSKVLRAEIAKMSIDE